MPNILSDDFSDQPLWWNDAGPSTFSSVDAAREVDVVVVGSGYAGLSCALELANGGVSVCVIDAKECGFGASTHNAGFLSGRAGVSKQINLETLVGKELTGQIFNEADDAYAYLQEFIKREKIDCCIDSVGRFVGAHTPAAYEKLCVKADEYNRDGSNSFHPVSTSEQHNYVASDYWFGGLFIENAGTLHPSLYHRALLNLCIKAGVQLISNTRVLAILNQSGRKKIQTTNGLFDASEVVIATNGYTDKLSPWHQRRLMPISSTIVASEILGEERVNEMLPAHCPVIDTNPVICFARPTPDRKRILFGGRARFSPLNSTQSASILHQQLTDMFPQMHDIKVTNAWSGFMAFTFDFMPKIGIHDGIHYALGCNGGCGIVMMSWLGRKVAKKILVTGEPASALESLNYRGRAFYSGNPWFLPIVGNWWRFRDWLEIRSVSRL